MEREASFRGKDMSLNKGLGQGQHIRKPFTVFPHGRTGAHNPVSTGNGKRGNILRKRRVWGVYYFCLFLVQFLTVTLHYLMCDNCYV